MKLDQHISDLLYRYDCVIVPDFGGFVANYRASKINSRTNTFTPPGKQLSFNRNLNLNDGLLANHIVQKYSVSYSEALSSIAGCISEYKRELKSGKRVLIENVGVLYLDESQNILFEPLSNVNYLRDAFGLEKFHVAPVALDVKETPIKRIPRVGIHPGRIAAAIALPLFLIGSAMIFQSKSDGKYGQIQLSNLGFSPVERTYEIRKAGSEFKKEDTEDLAFDALIKKAEQRVFVNEPVAEEIENWYVVGGCFSEKENAKAFVKRLKKEGYPAKQIQHFKTLHAVAYQGFEKESDARAFLASIKNDKNASAWLLKRK